MQLIIFQNNILVLASLLGYCNLFRIVFDFVNFLAQQLLLIRIYFNFYKKKNNNKVFTFAKYM